MRTEHIHQLVRTAESCVEMGALRKATVYFQRVIELSKPGEFTAELALYRLSNLYRSQARYVDAIDYMNRALECSPDEARYILILAELHFLIADYDQAASMAYDAAIDPMIRNEALNILYRIALKQDDATALEIAKILD